MANTRTSDGWHSARPSPAVLRAGAILDALADAHGQPLTIATLASQVGAPRSSIGNLCAALRQIGMVTLDERGFVLGRRLTELGQTYLESFQPVRRFLEHCQVLGPRLNDTVQLATLDGLDVVYLARRDGVHRIRIASEVGRRLPATCTAMGKVMLAGLPFEELMARLRDAEPFRSLTDRSATTMSDLLPDLQRTRDRGYATDNEESIEGVFCVAVAVPPLPGSREAYAVSTSLVKLAGTERRIPDIVELLNDLASGV